MAITINHQTNDISATSGSMTIDGSSVGVDNTKMPLAGGTFTGDVTFTGANSNLVFDKSANLLTFNDFMEFEFKDSTYGTTGRMFDSNGGLVLQQESTSASSDMQINNQDNTSNLVIRQHSAGNIRNAVRATSSGDVELYYQGSEKLATSSTGINVTGNITVSGTVDGRDVAADGTKLDGIAAGANVGIGSLAADTSPQLGGDLDTQARNIKFPQLNSSSMSSNYLSFGDKFYFVCQQGYNRIISDSAATGFEIKGNVMKLMTATGNEEYLLATKDGSVKLYYDGTSKFETKSTGIDVTGSIHAEDGAGANIGIKSTAGSHWKLGDAVGASNGTFALYDYTNSALRLAVDSSGNILVGTTSTGATTASDGAYITQDGQIIGRATGIVSYLNRRGSDGDILSLMKDGTGIGSVGNSGNNFYFQAQASDGKAQIKTHDGNEGISLSPSGYITFETAGSERMRLDSSGNLMVGGTTPGNAGTVTLNAGNAGSTVGGLQLWSTTSGTSYVQFGDESGTAANHYRGFLAYAHNGDSLRFGTAGSERMRLESDGDLHVDGNVIAYSTTISDERLKEDIKPITGALDKVGQLSGYTFTYKADGKQSAGVIAQEVEKVLPSAVTESTLPLQTDDDVEYKTVQYDQLVGLLIESVKELKAEIEELKNGASK